VIGNSAIYDARTKQIPNSNSWLCPPFDAEALVSIVSHDRLVLVRHAMADFGLMSEANTVHTGEEIAIGCLSRSLGSEEIGVRGCGNNLIEMTVDESEVEACWKVYLIDDVEL
jgi:hypothetical protein